MKRIKSNGLVFEVYEHQEPLFKMEADKKSYPLPLIYEQVVSDEEARAICKKLIDSGFYVRKKNEVATF